MKNCLKCGYQRLATDVAPETVCPECLAIYSEVEAAIAEKLRQQAKHKSANAPSARSSIPASVRAKSTKKMGLLPKFLLMLLGLGFVSALVLPKLRDPVRTASTQSQPTPSVLSPKLQDPATVRSSPPQAMPSVEPSYESVGKKRIKADILSARSEGLRPEVLADQERFARGALNALECVEGTSSCSTDQVETYLKGLPVGWVEKALGPPTSEQRLGVGDFYYWSFSLDEGGSKRSCRLQLEYGSVGECRPGVNGGSGACKFNFYC